MARQDIQAVTDRVAGVTNSMTRSARTSNYGEPTRIGRGSYVIYNAGEDIVDTPTRRAANRERQIAVAENAIGRRLTKYEREHLRIERLNRQSKKEYDYRERTRPTDRITGERLNIYRNMTAFKITLS